MHHESRHGLAPGFSWQQCHLHKSLASHCELASIPLRCRQGLCCIRAPRVSERRVYLRWDEASKADICSHVRETKRSQDRYYVPRHSQSDSSSQNPPKAATTPSPSNEKKNTHNPRPKITTLSRSQSPTQRPLLIQCRSTLLQVHSFTLLQSNIGTQRITQHSKISTTHLSPLGLYQAHFKNLTE